MTTQCSAMRVFYAFGTLVLVYGYKFHNNQTPISRVFWFKHILLARTVDIIKQMLTVLKLQGLEWKQHAYIIPFLKSVFYQMIFQTRLHTGRNTK